MDNASLAGRLRGHAYSLTWGEKAQVGALSNDLRVAADFCDLVADLQKRLDAAEAIAEKARAYVVARALAFPDIGNSDQWDAYVAARAALVAAVEKA